MKETPSEWLRRLFEFEYCAECGGDADDHEVCIVPGTGTFFARCKHPQAVADGGTATRDTSTRNNP
jgi:hypothetical protein